MPNIVSATPTDLWREKLARVYAGDVSLGTITVPAEFRIGEGGFQTVSSVKEPKTPDSARTALEAPDLPVGDDYVFTKALIPADLTFSSPNRLEVRCVVLSSEANVDNLGNAPELFEIGIFDGAGVMIAYSTFPIEIKTSSKSLEHLVFVDF